MAGKWVIERVRRPFWLHQVVEYLVGVVLLSAAFQSPDPVVPAVMGIVILLNAAIVIGPVGAFRLVRRGVHRRLDLVVIAVLVVGAVQPWLGIDSTGRFLLAGIAIVMFSVWFHTDFTERVAPGRRAAGGSSTSEAIGRRAGRIAAEGVKSAKRLTDR